VFFKGKWPVSEQSDSFRHYHFHSTPLAAKGVGLLLKRWLTGWAQNWDITLGHYGIETE